MRFTINVLDRVATPVNPPVIICGNSDYIIDFAFDDDWDNQTIKTARFTYSVNGENEYKEVVFAGTVCPMPILSNIEEVNIGVYAGELQTTTPAKVLCTKSILCGSDIHTTPPQDVYTQLLKILQDNYPLEAGVKANEVTKELINLFNEKVGTISAEHSENYNNVLKELLNMFQSRELWTGNETIQSGKGAIITIQGIGNYKVIAVNDELYEFDEEFLLNGTPCFVRHEQDEFTAGSAGFDVTQYTKAIALADENTLKVYCDTSKGSSFTKTTTSLGTTSKSVENISPITITSIKGVIANNGALSVTAQEIYDILIEKCNEAVIAAQNAEKIAEEVKNISAPIVSISADNKNIEPDENKNINIPLATTKFEQGEIYDEEWGENIITQIEVAGDAGLMSGEEKLKLKKIEEEAQKNIIEKIKLGDQEASVTDKTVTIPYARVEYDYPEVGIGVAIAKYYGGIVSPEDKEKIDTITTYIPLPTRADGVSYKDGVYHYNLQNNKVRLDCVYDCIELNIANNSYVITGDELTGDYLKIFNSEFVWKTGAEIQPQIAFPSDWVFVGYDVEDKVLVPQKNTVYDIVITGKSDTPDEEISVIAYVSGYEVSE